MKTAGKLIIFIFTFMALVSDRCAFAATPAPLPPAAQEAVNKGIIAAKIPDYLLAIRYFEEARKIAPQAPVIYLNMGLAESKIPGRELRAIAWFGAYLAAYPDAPNAAAVKEQVVVLEVRNQSTILRLIKTVQDAVGQLSDNDSQLVGVSVLWADAGDIAGAQKTTDQIRHSRPKSSALLSIAKAKIKVGDLAGAKDTLASALKSADRIESDLHIGILSPGAAKMFTQVAIAIAQEESGDIVGAENTFALARKTSERTDYGKGDFLSSYIAKARAEARTKPTKPDIAVSDWLKKLDDDNKKNDCPLNTGPFLDLADYLKKSMAQYIGPYGVHGLLEETAKTIIKAQNVIHQMLEQGAKK